jgi:peptidoglycan-associated lipoprotein
MWDWVKKNPGLVTGWVTATLAWAIIILGYVQTRGRETGTVAGLTTRVEQIEPEIKRITPLESKTQELSDILNREIIPALKAINERVAALPWVEQIEPEIKRITPLESKTQELSDILNREIIPALKAINERVAALPWVTEKVPRLEDELAPIRVLIAARLMERPLDVFFAVDRAEPRSDSLGVLRLNVAWLGLNPKTKIVLQGHADESGTAEYNAALAELRAETVKAFLVSAGVAADRISTTVYGKETPAVLGNDEAARKWNRRVHFAISEW